MQIAFTKKAGCSLSQFRRLTILLNLFLYASTFACTRTHGGTALEQTSPSSLDANLTFACTLKEEQNRLAVTYTVGNHGAIDVGVFNRIESAEPNGAMKYPSNLVYVDLEDSTLRVRKMVLPIPFGLTMTVRPVPYVTRVGPQQSFTEEFSLEAPIAAYDPLTRAALAGANPGADVVANRPEQARRLIFSVGVFRSDPGFRFIPVSHQDPDIYRVWPPGPPVDRQQVLSKEFVLATPITVLDYRAVPRR